MKKNVIFLRAFHIDPEPRLEKAAQWIKDINSDIGVCAIGWDRTRKSNKREIKSNLYIERFFAKGQYGKGFKKNILGLIRFNIFLFYKLMINKVDVIHACDLDTAIPAFLVSKLKGVKLVYDIYDFYSDNRNLGILDKPIRSLEKFIARVADLTIIADERRLCQIIDSNIDTYSNVITIYNTPDDKMLNNVVENKFLVSYVGVLIENRRILETANIVKSIDGANMICAGFGSLDNKLINLSEESKDILFKGKVDYDTALQIECKSKVILAMYDPNLPNNRYAAPNKLCEAMMLSKPIITSKGTLCADIVEKEKIGFVISHNDDNAMRDVLVYIQNNPDIIDEMGKRARKLYDNKYSAQIAKNKLKAKYKILLE